MSLFNNFPYSWQHRLNLDWIYEKVKHIPENAILTVCKKKPTQDGNVDLNASDVKAADQVDGVNATDGKITLGAWRKINNKVPDKNGSGTLSAGDIGAWGVINGKTPGKDGSGTLTASDVGATSYKLLWENKSASSAFPAQDISIPALSDYGMVLISFVDDAAYDYILRSIVVPVPCNFVIKNGAELRNGVIGYESLFHMDDSSVSNDHLVPTYIYGFSK